jgi:hypothetical protein
MVINKIIDEDKIEGFEAVTPRVKKADPVQPTQQVTADGQIIAVDSPEGAPPEPAKKAIFGRPTKRYSNRL